MKVNPFAGAAPLTRRVTTIFPVAGCALFVVTHKLDKVPANGIGVCTLASVLTIGLPLRGKYFDPPPVELFPEPLLLLNVIGRGMLGNLAAANVPLLILDALVVSVVAEAASAGPFTNCPLEFVPTVVWLVGTVPPFTFTTELAALIPVTSPPN